MAKPPPPPPPPPPRSADVFIYICCESTTAALFLHSRIVCCVCVLGKIFLCIISDLLLHEGFIILPDSSLSFYLLPPASISYADLLVRRTLNPFHFFVLFPHSRSYTYIHTVQYAAVRRIREILVRIRIRGFVPKFFCLLLCKCTFI